MLVSGWEVSKSGMQFHPDRGGTKLMFLHNSPRDSGTKIELKHNLISTVWQVHAAQDHEYLDPAVGLL